MAKFTKSGSGGGQWLDKKTLVSGDKAKLVSEAAEQDGMNGMQIVAKMRVKGDDGEAKNVAINAPTKNALIEAFGDDSKHWMNQVLTVHVEKTLIAGKRGVALYLIPEGYKMGETDDGFLVVVKEDAEVAAPEAKDDINPDDIPF